MPRLAALSRGRAARRREPSLTLSPFARRVLHSGALPEGARVLAACSGGADSVALVLALAELLRDGRLDAVAVGHVHHGLRPGEADADAAIVEALCASLELPFMLARCSAGDAAARRRRGLEEAARAVRREALAGLSEQASCTLIALAHTADDQAETVLLRLLRGAGAEGLSAMAAVSGPFVRPLLHVRRREARAYVHAASRAWASDPTNWSPASARSLVRELLERLETSLDEGVVDRLCETAAQLRDESAWLDEQARALLLPRLVSEAGPEGTPRLRVRDADAVGAAPPAVARRAVRDLLRRLRPDEPPPTADAIHRAARLFGAPPRPGSALLAGLALRRAGADVVAGPETTERVPREPQPLLPGGSLRWAGGRLTLREAPPPAEPAATRGPRILLDAGRVAAGLLVRTRRPGDRLRHAGAARRISDLLAARGIPAAWRDRHPLVCLAPDAATIVWLPGHDADPGFVATPDSPHALELSWTPAEQEAGAPA